MRIKLQVAAARDAREIASLRIAATQNLTSRYGKGHWSGVTDKGVRFAMRTSTVYVAGQRNNIVATVALSTTKPWAIDRKYFSACERPLYLTAMAVDPEMQGKGIGRACVAEVRRISKRWPGDAIRLDAYDAEAGAGEFYRKCGFREVGRASYRNTPLIYFEMLL